jgi:hypothetical protein
MSEWLSVNVSSDVLQEQFQDFLKLETELADVEK